MANDLSGNPWYIDTVGAVFTSRVRIKSLIWANGTVGNTLLIQDNKGRDIINTTWAAGENHTYGELSWVAGLHVITLSGGNLQIYIQK